MKRIAKTIRRKAGHVRLPSSCLQVMRSCSMPDALQIVPSQVETFVLFISSSSNQCVVTHFDSV